MQRTRIWIPLVLVLLSSLSCPLGNDTIVIDMLMYGDANNSEGQNCIRIVNAFEEANPDIEIDFELLYDTAYHNRVAERLASGDVPDMAYMGTDVRWGWPWQVAGQQFDHRALIDPDYYDLSLIPEMGLHGEIYYIPLGTSNITTVLYMNRELVSDLGFSAPTTYDEIKSMVSAADTAGLRVISINGDDSWAWGSCLMSCIIARLSGEADWVSQAVAGKHRFTDNAFVDSLEFLQTMRVDGVIKPDTLNIGYATNLTNFDQEKTLFMIQGQWAAGGLSAKTQAKTSMIPFPQIPGEKSATAGSVAAAIQVGYGLTKAGAADPDIREAGIRFLKFFHSYPETTKRLSEGAIVAPILKDYQMPDNLPPIVSEKVNLSQSALWTDVIDCYLSGEANDTLNSGMQDIINGRKTPQDVATEVQNLLAH